jgi:hypothetical protein
MAATGLLPHFQDSRRGRNDDGEGSQGSFNVIASDSEAIQTFAVEAVWIGEPRGSGALFFVTIPRFRVQPWLAALE